ncbi:hypothetical protein UABAM_04993 [Candidatus Uabimicrobium amorphum]|uniref:ARG and Rhodanese-Phosphatase-superfamily-associated domain-containing protein n=2 Tax=Uabimicrobium amorphum TaxID=2596890 RepID=A0A5S9IRY0_UABAM|nr:hypothetical protein UABAM_04993 [Candidatus Uabimicrobium amorphum]
MKNSIIFLWLLLSVTAQQTSDVTSQHAVSTIQPQKTTILSSEEDYVVTGPYTHDNLAIFLVYNMKMEQKKFISLKKAVAKNKIIVDNRNVINMSNERVYLQKGDIVYSNKHDLVLQNNFVTPANAQKISLAMHSDKIHFRQNYEPRSLPQAKPYIVKLQDIIRNKSEVVGYVCVINGKIHRGDIYATSALFHDEWPKHLALRVQDAIKYKKKTQKALITSQQVEKWLQKISGGEMKVTQYGKTTILTKKERGHIVQVTQYEQQKIHQKFLFCKTE